METVKDSVAFLQRFIEPHPWSISLAMVVLLAVSVGALWPTDSNQPPKLRDPIPYISNTYQYMANMNKFLSRATKALKKNNIVGFHLGPKNAYFITGVQNIQTLFRTSPSIGFEAFILIAIETMWGATPDDIAKFAKDKSGRLPVPLPGTEDTPDKQRYWASMHSILNKYLSQSYYTNALAATYQRFFSEQLEKYPREWTEMRVMPFMKKDMATAAVISLLGNHIFELSPDLLELFWEYDEVLGTILFGPPKWLFRDVYAKAERFCAATGNFFQDAWTSFDWNGPDAEADWEPIFGSRFFRELAKWMKQCEFSPRTCGGITGVMGLVAMNANTIPVCAWAVMELAKDPDMFHAVREEVETTYVTDPITGHRTIDAQKLVVLPLLQSFYIEILRMRVSINVTREVVQPLDMEGYTLAPGSVLQAPTEISHYNESVWGADGHPASEFWAARHVKHVEEVDETGKTKRVPQFEMVGRPADFFPYGGGLAMCPGRHFAKQEIMLTIAMLASRFDMEFVEWLKMDGTVSDRPPRNDIKYSGAAGVPPDRDMRVRWKRIW